MAEDSRQCRVCQIADFIVFFILMHNHVLCFTGAQYMVFVSLHLYSKAAGSPGVWLDSYV